MNKYLFAGLLIVSSSNAAELKDSLQGWSPISVSENAVVLNQTRVTKPIYEAVVTMGVCLHHWTENKLSDDAIAVLNLHATQGFVLEKPATVCDAINDLKGTAKKLKIYEFTHMN